jgi:parallel beta-helix repeat protein
MHRSKIRYYLYFVVAGCIAIILAAVGATLLYHHSGTGGGRPAVANSGTGGNRPRVVRVPGNGKRICGQPILHSPYSYHGAPGPYASGTAGLPTYGRQGSDFPNDTAGVVLPTGTRNYVSYDLKAGTVYYLLPGIHTGSIMADENDAFVGGFYRGKTSVLSGNYLKSMAWAIDSNSSAGDQSGVHIEYLTIEKFTPNGNASAINPDSNTDWTLKYNTVTLNVPGAGVILGTDSVLQFNCLTLNGQYGFQAVTVGPWARDSLTGGPYNLAIADNEISYNDTCDFSGRLVNRSIGWSGHDPVPTRYQNPKCGRVTPDGDQGGFKLWQTDGVTIKGNYIHDNWGPGAWADTDNANTTFTGNTINRNEGEAIFEEISYNFSITGNYIADNDWADGLGNPGFPQPAIYISESGSDTTIGSVPACPEASCARQGSYPHQSVISHNTLVDNGGSIFLWQNSNRHCGDGSDGVCTLVGGPSRPFTLSSCAANLRSASVSTVTYAGDQTGRPPANWWDGCQWQTANVSITHNTIDFNPADIADCNQGAWPACGAGGIFSEYGSPSSHVPSWAIPTQLTFFLHDRWADNTYNGPSTFYAWSQGNGDNPVSWADWTGRATGGHKCGSPSERQSGYCAGPFGQDTGSRYRSAPAPMP